MWIFGYGSIMWRPGFDWVERHAGQIGGWSRRFYQGSVDHRGTPERPGRVVTLLPWRHAVCHGVAYRVEGAEAARVVAALDHRERGGYARVEVPVRTAGGDLVAEAAHVYLAGPTNPNWLGPAPAEAMARQIAAARGPSGANADYLLRLAACLRELAVDEPHVARLVALLPPAGG